MAASAPSNSRTRKSSLCLPGRPAPWASNHRRRRWKCTAAAPAAERGSPEARRRQGRCVVRCCIVILLAIFAQVVSLHAFAGQPFDPEFLGPPTLWPPADPASDKFIGPTLVEPFPILDAQVLPGKLARLEWKGSQSFSGGEVVSPVVVVHGVRPGPVLCLTAGIHGDELNGVEIVRQITRIIDPADLGGTIVAVPY